MQQPALAEAELQLHHELTQLTQAIREGADRLSKYDGTVARSNAKQLEDQVQHYLRRLKSKLSDLQHAANEQETPEEVQRVAAVVAQHHEASEAARKAFQAARIQYDRNVQKHEEQQRRELIGAVDFSQRQQKFAKEQDVLEGSQDVTASLRRTRQLMMQNLEQTHGNISVLGASNAKIQGASDELAGQKHVFKETHKHQRTLQKQSWMDRWAMYIGVAFFLMCVGYISLRRTPAFIKQPVYALLHMKQGGQPFTHQDYASLNVPPGTFVPRKEQVFGAGQGKLPPEWEAWDENFAGVSGPADGSGPFQEAEWLDAEQHEPVGRAGGQVWRRGAHGELLEGREPQQQQQQQQQSEAGSCTAPDEHSGHSECSAGHAAHHQQQQQQWEGSAGERPVHGHKPELPPPPAPAPVPLNEAAPVDVTAGQHADPRAMQQQQQQDSTWQQQQQQQQRASGSSTQDQFDQGPEYFDDAADDAPDSHQEPWGLDEDSLPIPANPHPPGYHPHHGHPHHQQQRSPTPTAAGIIDPEAAEHAAGGTAHEHYDQRYSQHERYNGQQDRGISHEGVEEDPDEMEYWRQQREAQRAADMERMQQEQRAAAAAAEAERARAAAAHRQRMQQQRGQEREHEHDRRWERPPRPPLRQPDMEGGRPPSPQHHEQQQQQRWGGEGDDSHLEPRTPPQEPADVHDMHPEASQQQQQQQQQEVHDEAQVEEPVVPPQQQQQEQEQQQHVDGGHVEPEAPSQEQQHQQQQDAHVEPTQPAPQDTHADEAPQQQQQQQQQQHEEHEQDTGPVRPPVQAPVQHHEAHNEHVDEQGQQPQQQQQHAALAQPEHAAEQGHQEQQHEAPAQPGADVNPPAEQQQEGAPEHGHEQAAAVDDLAAAVEAERLQQQQQKAEAAAAEAAAVRELQQFFEAGAPQRPPVATQPTEAVTPEQQQQPAEHVAQQQEQQQQQHEEQLSEGAVGSPVLDVEHAAAEAADAAAETAAAAQRVVHDQAVATGYVAPDQGHDVSDSGQQQDIHAEGAEGAHGGGAAGSDQQQQQQQPAHMAEQEAAVKAQQEAAAAAERAAQEKAAAAAAEEAARREEAAAAEAEAQRQAAERAAQEKAAAEEAARREAAAAAAAAEREAQEKAAAAAAAEQAARREAAAAAEREAKRLAAEREMQERAAAAAAAEEAARQAAAAAAEREAQEKAAAEEAARREAAAAAEREAQERAAAEAEAQRQAAAAAAEEAARREAAAAAEREAQEKAAAAAAAEEAAQQEAAAAAAAEAEAQRQAAAAAAAEQEAQQKAQAATAPEVYVFDTAAGPDAAALIWQAKQDEVAAKIAQQAQQGHNTATPAAPPFVAPVEADTEEDEQSGVVVSGSGLVGLWSSLKEKISLGPRMVAAQEHQAYDEEPPLPFKLELRPLEGAEHFFDEPYGDYYFNSDGSWDSREGSLEGEASGVKGAGVGKGGKGGHHGKGGSGVGGGKQHVRPGVGAKAQDAAAASAAHEYQAYGDYPEDSVDEMDYDAAAELNLLGEDEGWGDEGGSLQQGGAAGAAQQQHHQQQQGVAPSAAQHQQQQPAGTAELR